MIKPTKSSMTCRQGFVAPLVLVVLLVGMIDNTIAFAPSKIATSAFGHASRAVRSALHKQQQRPQHGVESSSLFAGMRPGSDSSSEDKEVFYSGDNKDFGQAKDAEPNPQEAISPLSNAMRVGNQGTKGPQGNKIPPMIRSQEELEQLVQNWGYPASRGKLIWIMWTNSQGGVETQIDSMVAMPDHLRNRLKQQFAPAAATTPKPSASRLPSNFQPPPIPIRSRGELENIVTSWGYTARQGGRIWTQWEQIVQAHNQGDIERSVELGAQLNRDISMMSSLPDQLKSKIINQFTVIPVQQSTIAEPDDAVRISEEQAAADTAAEVEQARLQAEQEEMERIANEQAAADAAAAAEAEQAILKEEKERIEEQERLEEQARLQAEQEEKERIEEQQRIEEEKRLEAEKEEKERAEAEAEAKRLEEEARIKEQERLEAEQLEQERLAREAEAKRLEEETLAEEARIKEQERLEAERLEEERLAEEARIKEQERLEAERLEEERLAEEAEAKRFEEERLAEEARIKAEEEARIAEEMRLAEEWRIEEEKRIAEELRLKAEEEARIAKEKADEEARIAKEKAEEEARLAEEARIEEEDRLAEQARIEEEARLAEQARIEEEARLAEQARIEEEERLAEQARIEEEARLAEQARIEEEERLAEQARLEEEARLKAAKEEEERLAEQARIEEEARVEEQARLEQERLEKIAEEKRIADEKAADDARIKAEEQARIAEEQAAALAAKEAKIADEQAQLEKELEDNTETTELESEPETDDDATVSQEILSMLSKAEKEKLAALSADEFSRRLNIVEDQLKDDNREDQPKDENRAAEELIAFLGPDERKKLAQLSDEELQKRMEIAEEMLAEESSGDKKDLPTEEARTDEPVEEAGEQSDSASDTSTKTAPTPEEVAEFFENFEIKVVLPVANASPENEKETTCNVRLPHIVDDKGYVSFEQLILLTSMFVASITNNGDDAQLEERDGDYYLSLDGSGTDTSLVSLEYIDNENDTITVASTKELLDAMELFHDEQTLKLSVRFKAATGGTTASPGISAMRGGTVRANPGIQAMRGGTVVASTSPMGISANVGASPTANPTGSVEAAPMDVATTNDSDSAPKETGNPPDVTATSDSVSDEAATVPGTSDSVSEQAVVSASPEEGTGARATEEDTTVSKQEEPPSSKVINSFFSALGTGLEAVEKGLDLIPKNKKGKPDWQAKRNALRKSIVVAKTEPDDANDSPVAETGDEVATESPPTEEVKSDKQTKKSLKWDATKPDSLPHFAQVSSGDSRISPPVSSPPEAAFTISENKSVPPPAFGLSETGNQVAMKIPTADENLESLALSDEGEIDDIPKEDGTSFADDTPEVDEESSSFADDIPQEDTSTTNDTADETVDTETESAAPIRSRQELAQIVEYYGYPKALGMQIWDEGVRIMMESNAKSFASARGEGASNAAIVDLERRIDIMTNLPLEIREKLKRKFFN